MSDSSSAPTSAEDKSTLDTALSYLREAVKAGKQFDYYIFYGHDQKVPGVLDKSCLSQWFPANFTIDGVQYRHCEQYMMAQKALLFEDHEMMDKILEATDPKICKSLGRKVRGFSAEVWDKYKSDIVYRGNLGKFSQNKELGMFLLNTGDAIIAEANPRDNTWGIALRLDNPKNTDPRAWRGKNLLGFALMQVREFLKLHYSTVF